MPPSTTISASSSKRTKPSSAGQLGHHRQGEQIQVQDQAPLLPGLPNHLAQLCLSLLPPTLLFSVCRPWRRLLYSPSFPSFLSFYALLSSSNPKPNDDDDPISFFTFDPISATWTPLPFPPPNPPLRRLLLRHPSFIARDLPIQSIAAGDHLVLLAATSHRLLPALPRPLVFHPSTSLWTLGPPIAAPRRWCAVGSAGETVYIASGVGSEYNADVARSVEKWDPHRRGAVWEKVAPLRNGRFSREAVELVASRGRLCMVNMKGHGAKEGVVYDLGSDRWEEMPAGLRAGWTGPAAAMESIYVVDEGSGVLRVYDWERDTWTVVIKSERLKGAVQMAARGGRVCVACGGGARVVVVDVVARPARMWVVDPPEGKRVVALHVLPRMSRPES